VTDQGARPPREPGVPSGGASRSAGPPPPGPAVGDLAARQAALVDALLAGAPDPPGFPTDRLAVARRALLRKRAGAVAAVWPQLAASLGPDWPAVFAASVGDRPPAGALVEGWDLARTLHRRGELGAAAAGELAEREVTLRRTGTGHAHRRLPAVRRVGRGVGGGIVVQVAGRVVRLR
jgi:hypothetical protein